MYAIRLHRWLNEANQLRGPGWVVLHPMFRAELHKGQARGIARLERLQTHSGRLQRSLSVLGRMAR